jgi:hypothetical protein
VIEDDGKKGVHAGDATDQVKQKAEAALIVKSEAGRKSKAGTPRALTFSILRVVSL